MAAHDRTKVLIAGGGVAALEAALALRKLAGDRVDVEFLAPDPHFWYQPLSVAEPFGLAEPIRLELDAVAHHIGASGVRTRLTGIDAWRHVAHTSTNVELEYDILLIACGTLPMPAIPGAVTFRGGVDSQAVSRVLGDLATGEARSVAFAVPWGAVWSLPAYELALLTAAHLRGRGVGDGEVAVVTPEAEPLQVFGPPASAAIRRLLADAGVELRCSAYGRSHADGMLELVPGPHLAADRVVALPRLEGAPLDGIPQTLNGFIPVDAHGRVHGVADVYAAGDITSFPVKQGGIASQQADAAAEAIAASLGADVEPAPFRPVLRGVLLTGRAPRYLRRELAGQPEHEPVAALDALWWPPAKIVGRYLAPFLADLTGAAAAPTLPAPEDGAVPVEVDLDEETTARVLTSPVPHAIVRYAGPRVSEVMDASPVRAGSDESLGDVAARLLEHGATAAVVEDGGRLVGIVTASDVVRASAARVGPERLPVRLWMTAEPVVVPLSYPASAAALLMSEAGVHHLPIVDDDRVVGMLDLEHVLARAAPAAHVAD